MMSFNDRMRFVSLSLTILTHVLSDLLKGMSLTLGLVLLLYYPSDAHDYWYEFEDQDYVLYRGHHFIKHEGEPEGEKVVPYDPDIIKHVYCASSDGVIRTIDPPPHYPARIPGPCAALTVEMDTGYWSKTLTETFNQSKEKVPDAVYSWRALESTKLLNSWTDTHITEPLSDGLEILLEKNPFVLENGQKLRLLVMLEGKPLEGVTMAYDGKTRGVTGKDGKMNIRVRHGGLQVITGSIKEPPRDRNKADKLVRATALFFQLPEER